MQFIGNRYDILDYNGKIEAGKLYKARDAYSNNIVYVKLINNSELIKETFKPDLIDESTVVNHIALPQIAKVYIILGISSPLENYHIFFFLLSTAKNARIFWSEEIKID